MARGYDEAGVSFFALGLAVPEFWGGLNPYTNVSSGTLLPGRGLWIAENITWPGFTIGYGLVDVQTPMLRMFPVFHADSAFWVKMYEPGPTYRPDRFIFDVSGRGAAAATVWNTDALTPVDTVPCGVSSGFYTAAQLSPTTCLSQRLGVVVRNGTDTIIPNFYSAPWGEFRLAPGGRWAVLRTELDFRRFRSAGAPMHWPVFDQSGNLAYTIDTLFHVTGAAFSSHGDTMFLTVSVRDTTTWSGGRFALALYETATGRLLGQRSFPDRALQDVALDPGRPVIYVGGVRLLPTSVPYAVRYTQYLTVLDRRTLDVIADITARSSPAPVLDASLVFHSGGRVSVVGNCGADCGGLWVLTFDLP